MKKATLPGMAINQTRVRYRKLGRGGRWEKECREEGTIRIGFGGEGVDCAIECAGSPEARVQTVRSVRTWGQACFVGEGGTVTLEVSPHLLRRQVTLHASWTFSSVG